MSNKMFTIQEYFQEAKGSTMFAHAWEMHKCQEYLLPEDDIKY